MINAMEAGKLSDENGMAAINRYMIEVIEKSVRKAAESGRRSATSTSMPPYPVQDRVIDELNKLGYKAKIHHASNQLDNSYIEVSW
ncbi:hypothetical protein phiAS5_ORF0032 [Aeromonas phage phiAS5]|uniref:Uncharacterized protein n=1 Tax=Aeromonas phage phiAS5 TaxID=879630 RepID=E1A2C9_9CAUD|nr:hypothetical protein phiAS5_ORF0032 [Aeromonas phage phiAS5]ADM79875.1 hypothetical protein phiAS5_ORF0032 [Aeromonas phage phiAS5]BES53019.1 hypothetical protein [Aeromonas phage phiWae14]